MTAPASARSVDVVVPCYNYARFLKRCVESALNQPRVDVRVLIIDDCSSDDTPAVGAELARDPRVEFRRHAQNMRHIATYNEGLIGWAKAQYSLLLSADDWLAPEALTRAVDLLEAHPEATFVCGYAMIVEDQPPAESIPKLDGKWCILSGEQYTEECVRSANPVSTPTAVVRTAIQQSVGGYRPELPHSGDMEMWMKFAARGPIGVIRDVQAFYRWHGANMGRAQYNSLLGDLREQEAACEQPLALWPEPRRGEWTRQLRRRLGQEAFWAANRAFAAGDLAGCDDCLRYALEHDDSLAGSKRLLHLKVKRMLGSRAWNGIKLLADKARGVKTASGGEYFNVGKLTGWGPADASAWRAPSKNA